MQGNPPSQHTAILGRVAPLGRRGLKSRVAVGHPGIVAVPIEKMCSGEYQAVVIVVWIWRQILDEQPK